MKALEARRRLELPIATGEFANTFLSCSRESAQKGLRARLALRYLVNLSCQLAPAEGVVHDDCFAERAAMDTVIVASRGELFGER